MIFLSDIENSVRKAHSSGMTSVTVHVRIGTNWIVNGASMVKDGSYWVLHGVEELARAAMQVSGKYIDEYRVEWYVNGSSEPSDTEDMVIYSSAMMRKPGTLTADVFCSHYFMTRRKTAWMIKNNSFYLNYYCTSDTAYSIVYTKADGTTSTTTGTVSGEVATNLYVAYVSGAIKAEVTMGSRTFTIYYLDFDSSMYLRFRNAFNALEYVSLPCSVEEDPKTEFEEASQGNVVRRYDVEEQLELKVKTAPLPSFMYNMLLDMCRSRVVERYDAYRSGSTVYGSWSEVYLKDYKLPKSNEPNSQIVLEMTLVYSNKQRNAAIDFE